MWLVFFWKTTCLKKPPFISEKKINLTKKKKSPQKRRIDQVVKRKFLIIFLLLFFNILSRDLLCMSTYEWESKILSLNNYNLRTTIRYTQPKLLTSFFQFVFSTVVAYTYIYIYISRTIYNYFLFPILI